MSVERSTKSVPIFEIKKKHAWKSVVLRWVEIFLIITAVSGTVIWILVSANFSFQKVFGGLTDVLKPKVASKEAQKASTFEGRIKESLEKEKIVEIGSIAKTSEEDYQVITKSGINIFFTEKKNLDSQVRTLQTLLAKAKIENRSLKKVDFRFAKIVIEY